MDAEKANYEVARMARLAGVSRSGFYVWGAQRAAGPGPQALRRAAVDEAVRAAHERSDGVDGAPRITATLARDGLVVDRKTVAASMRRQGLGGISPRRWAPVATIPGTATHSIPERAEDAFDTGGLDAVWISDSTYLRTDERWLYLCVVRDGCSRRVLGWAMDVVQTTDLVERAVRMAQTLRGSVPDGVVFHADRGCQYTSAQLLQVCQELDVRQSMGRTGVCWDNPMAESSWSTLKTEFYDRRTWPTRTEALRKVARWIEIVYNCRRLHSAPGYTTPVEHENAVRVTGARDTEARPQAA